MESKELEDAMQSLGFVFSKTDGLWHLWVKDSDREIARVAPEAATKWFVWHTTELGRAKAEAYDEALFDSGYDKELVGPVTRGLVDRKRQKYQPQPQKDNT